MTNTETCSDITYKLLQESSSHPCFPILHTLSLFILTLGSSIIGYRPVVFIVWLLFTGVVFSSMSYWWPSQLLTWSLSILSTIKLSTRVYGHLVPWSYPLRGRRLRAATALAHVHIRTPTSLSFRLVNPPLRAHPSQHMYPGYSLHAPIPQTLSAARVSSPSRPPAAVYVYLLSFSGANIAIWSSPVLSQSQLRSQIRHPSFFCMWHVFPVISLPSLTIVAILSHSMRLFQQVVSCLMRSFPNELNASCSGAPFCNHNL